MLCPINEETTVIGAWLLTSKEAHECLKSCGRICLTFTFSTISPYELLINGVINQSYLEISQVR